MTAFSSIALADTRLAPKPLRIGQSTRMAERFKSRHKRRRIVNTLYVLCYASYLVWRFTIINTDSLTLSLVYFVAECLGFILGLTIIGTSRRYQHYDPPAPLPNVSVDVLLPTYKEPIDIIRRTALAAKHIDYPHQTFILDDGRRDDVKALAEELGLIYLSRPANIHAKAGNLNFGLAHSTADYVMVFDADHIAMPHALNLTLGFFADPQVAMVQTAQDYYNIDAYQYMTTKQGGIWNDQSFFFYMAQPGRDVDNGASCVGTGVVYRRAAIDAIGGIPFDTVTEDVQTSLKMHKAGMRVIYLNEPVSYGIAEAELGEYYKTRQRWAHGNLHALQCEKVLTCKGLTLKQRLSYLSLGLVYLEGWQQLLLFMVPIGALVFGLQPFEMSLFNILVVLLFPFLNYALLQESGCGFARFWANELFAMARWPVYLLSSAGLFGLPLQWRSSRKTIQARIQWRLMMPQITVMLLSLAAVMVAIVTIRQDFKSGPVLASIISLLTTGSLPPGITGFGILPPGYTLDLVVVASSWALYNAVRALCFIVKTVQNARNSHRYFRFAIPMIAQIGDLNHYATVSHISESWVRFTATGHAQLQLGDDIAFRLFLPAGPLDLIVRIETKIAQGSATRYEGHFISLSSQRDRLANALYSVDWHRECMNRYAYFLTPIDALLSLVTPAHKESTEPKPQDWQAVLMASAAQPSVFSHYGLLALQAQKMEGSLLTFSPLIPGNSYPLLTIGPNGSSLLQCLIVDECALSSLAEKGLDGAVARRYRFKIAPVAQKQQSVYC
ncbi:MAG: glycosyltransferase [Rickettsiales bacterium]|nr:glycosyltransferase [Rickettsiales bacterium]